jgi:Glycosyl hydrolase family 99
MRLITRMFAAAALSVGMVVPASAQPAPQPVPKTNPLPVYVHYMPWFEIPATNNGAWGLHWTMANQNPNVIVNAATGKRQIAAHYYPLIGPYASSDPDVIEYHLLLTKYAGIDGLLLDYYGNGANDLPLILRNTDSLVNRTASVGLKFGMVFEEQFAPTLAAATANMGLVGSRYIAQPNYIRQPNGKPLVLVFGPQRYQTPADWTQILGALPNDPEFLTLWYESADAGANADGEFSWIYSDFLNGLRNFYLNRASSLATVGGSAYPGFDSFYAQGGWGGPTWTIPLNNGQALDQTLALATQNQSRMDFLQLATFNDFGEGTMLEPTEEFGFSFLNKVQVFTGVPYGVTELTLVHRLYKLRKRYPAAPGIQAALDEASGDLSALLVPDATFIIDSLENLTPQAVTAAQAVSLFTVSPNPVAQRLSLTLTAGITGPLRIIDPLGRVVWAGPAGPVVDVSGLAPGLYFVELTSGGQRQVRRFAKE